MYSSALAAGCLGMVEFLFGLSARHLRAQSPPGYSSMNSLAMDVLMLDCTYPRVSPLVWDGNGIQLVRSVFLGSVSLV